jgi:limonene-1,2-epoxide hydrolase
MTRHVFAPALKIALFLFIAVTTSFAADPTPTPDPAEPEPIRVVRAYIDAFNQHNIAAMAERIAPDFVWFNVTSDRATVQVKGRDMLRKTLANYFESTPNVRSEIDGVANAGDYVSFRERANWTSLLGPRSQSSLAIYEVKGGLITRAWYYPAAK